MTAQDTGAPAPIVILGTGLAGFGVARELRKHDKTTPLVMVTRDDGASYYKPDISEALAKGNTPDDLVKKDAEAMAAELDASIRAHDQVEAIDRDARTVTLDGDTLDYSRLVLALGANPVRLNLSGDAIDSIYKINNLVDYRIFRQGLAANAKVTILGAGLIGSEFANDLITAGHKVSVAEPASWPLAQLLPEQAGNAVKEALADAGVHWHLGRAVAGVQHGDSDGINVVLDDDSVIHADVVLSAVGLAPEIDLAEQAGLAVDRGIQVDRTLATSDPAIYALGDCAEVCGLWRPYVAPLMQCARTLGKTLAGAEGDPPGQVSYPTLPIIVKTHLCPVVVYPPVTRPGEWQITGKTPDIEAQFVDEDGNTQGFALTGEATGKRRDYLKEAPPLMR